MRSPENDDDDDPFQDLEDIGSSSSKSFVKFANSMCMRAHGDPRKESTTAYSRLLNYLESDERIPLVTQMGKEGNSDNGDGILYNLWKDNKNPKGIWRKTTMSSYENSTTTTNWTTVLDIDELSIKENISWIWRGSRVLPRSRDSSNTTTTRALISLSKENSPNEVVIRELDLLTCEFVGDVEAFHLPQGGKSRAYYRSRDVLMVCGDFGPDTLTKYGYPKTVREWVRGTNISEAPIVFEGEATDIAVSSYIDDQRLRGGGIFEVRTRTIAPNNTIYFARKIKPEHLLGIDDPQRVAVGVDPGPFKELETPGDAEIDFVGNILLITLRSDWSPESGKKFKGGSLLYVNSHKFVKYGPKDRIYHVLFQPESDRVLCENYCTTKNFIVLSLGDNLQSKLEFYKFEKDANKLRLVGMDKKSQIRSINIRSVDPYENDEFWLTSTSYIEPTSLYLADASKMDTDDKKRIRKTGSEGYAVRKLRSLSEQFDSTDLEVIQKSVPSKDGTDIPYTIIRKKPTSSTTGGGNNNNKNITLLYGYGGFEVSLGPQYIAPTGIAWLDRGGVYVEANIRGGGEFGPAWHQAAMKENRNKAYEDFIAVAEDLIKTKICKAKTLGIRGGSNGGLLVANMYTMRPDLFGAIHCAMPILDMKRFKAMAGAESWVDEFGDPDTTDWDKFLKKYSPYHNIDDGNKKHPPILFTTNMRDGRIHPGHARKMTKRLWEMGRGKKWPTFYYENTECGTGGAEDAKHYAFQTALGFDFMFNTLTKNANKEKDKEKSSS